MVLVPSNVKDCWEDAADQLNTDLGYTCTLVFESGQTLVENTVTTPSAEGLMPRVSMPYGGRGRGFQVPGSDTMSESTTTSTQHIQVNETEKSITARVYHIIKDFDRFNISVRDNANVYELVLHKKYIPDLMRAKHIILYADLPEKRTVAKLVKPPTAYGLGPLHQCRSFWEEV